MNRTHDHEAFSKMPLRTRWAMRALQWSLFPLAMLVGTLSWLCALLLLVAGFLVVQATGWTVPEFAWVGAFVVGMPVGAWLELRGVKH